jgi:hypothetical protein
MALMIDCLRLNLKTLNPGSIVFFMGETSRRELLFKIRETSFNCAKIILKNESNESIIILSRISGSQKNRDPNELYLEIHSRVRSCLK